MTLSRCSSVNFARITRGLLALYLGVWLCVLAPSHHHEFAQSHHASHQDCQLCLISSQPYMASAAVAASEATVALTLLLATAEPQLLPRPHFSFASRASPSV